MRFMALLERDRLSGGEAYAYVGHKPEQTLLYDKVNNFRTFLSDVHRRFAFS